MGRRWSFGLCRWSLVVRPWSFATLDRRRCGFSEKSARGTTKCERRIASAYGDFDVSVAVAPEPGDTGEPILGFDAASDAVYIFCEEAGRRWEFGAGDFPADGAGGDLDLRVIANALDLAEFGVGHDVNFVAFFGKPDGGIDGDAGLAKGGEREVALAVNFLGDGHSGIVNVGPGWE